MADKKLLENAFLSLVEGNEAEASKMFAKYMESAKIEIMAQKLSEAVEDEEIPTDNEVETLKQEIAVEEPTAESGEEVIDLDSEEEIDLDGEVPAEDTVEVIPTDEAESALQDSGELVGIEEDPDFLALIDEFDKKLGDSAVEVPSEVLTDEEPVEEPVEGDVEIEDVETSEETPVEEPVEGDSEVLPDGELEPKKQEEIDIEKFIR